MKISELKKVYIDLLDPIFGDQLCVDDREEDRDWVTIILDGTQEEFFFSLYGVDCVRLYWCNECFIFDKNRNNLVSSDTYGEIVFEDDFDIEQLPHMIVTLIQQLKDSIYVEKKEIVRGKTLFGYDTIKDYLLTAKTHVLSKRRYQLANITIKYIYGEHCNGVKS